MGLFRFSDDNKAVYQMCQNYCTHADKMYEAGVGAYLYGVPGVGKTHLTACMGNALADKLYTVLFTSFVEIESKLKEIHNYKIKKLLIKAPPAGVSLRKQF